MCSISRYLCAFWLSVFIIATVEFSLIYGEHRNQAGSRSYFGSKEEEDDGTQQQVSVQKIYNSRQVRTTTNQPPGSSFRRVVYKRQNVTLHGRPRASTTYRKANSTTTRTRYGTVGVTSTGSSSISSSRRRYDYMPKLNRTEGFQESYFDLTNPTRESDNRAGTYVYTRQNTSISHGSSSSRSTGTGSRINTPVLWNNRTWHWSTNRTRGYDPDLDGTTLPPDDFEDYDQDIFTGGGDKRNPLGSSQCEQSCYPATGNLLIGREDKLSASSTCGIKKPERYCIVSHLAQRKKCFICHSRTAHKGDRWKYHRIENIVTRVGEKRFDKWWQAENGQENVQIQLNLEAEFLFTHIIITFQTFRPAAMIIERSSDNGTSWQVYQYFASNCQESFPFVKRGPRTRVSDIICESQYSSLDQSKYGEVIFKALPPNLHVEDLYSEEIQNFLKMTNLRITFTKLHTLGDEILNTRVEVKEKYYYAIADMIVRGSCSCYGHASSCINEPDQPHIEEMVYGRCNCTHHTKGRNCGECEDFYNDVPWKPANGRQTNECKRCNCNNHAWKCEHNADLYEKSGRVSGGVCQDCQHNTIGNNCEQCKPFYYKDPGRSLDDPYVCQACDCDPRGCVDEGYCESRHEPNYGVFAGTCNCKKNVEGKRCDRCKNGFWNFERSNPDGCDACSCSTLGTVGNLGCDFQTGECRCKQNVVGRDCNQCAPEHYGMSEDEQGCNPCECDVGGSYDNNCDVISGMCRCRPHATSRKCDHVEPNYFIPQLDFLVYEAELASGSLDTQVSIREPYADREPTWTGLGFMRVFEGSTLEFDVSDIPTSMEYDIVVRYEPQIPGTWESTKIIIQRLGLPDGPCRDSYSSDNDRRKFSMNSGERHAVVQSVCLEKGKEYKITIDMDTKFKTGRQDVDIPNPSVLIDSIAIIPRPDNMPFFKGTPENEYNRQNFERFRCGITFFTVSRPVPPDYCKKYLYSIGFYVFDGAHECHCDPMGSRSAVCAEYGGRCECKPNVVGNRCDRCAPGFYDFGPEGCKPCDCHYSGSLDNFCEPKSGQCKCRPNTYGRKCDECQIGYWNYPNCQRCDCNGFSDTCDSKTGVCNSCRERTSGTNCERCERGTFGNPTNGVPCRGCPCPGISGSELSHADTCDFDPRSQNVICHCHSGYTGEKCDQCATNYWGDPNVPGGSCRSCDCNGNIDVSQPGSCDSRTGECLKCLYNSEGSRCESCAAGFWGDATRQQCIRCVCNPLGTRREGDIRGVCDRLSGDCPCLPNVEGKECDTCLENHWKLASGVGCEPCNCDPLGSYSAQCNEFDGRCQCRPGHGGDRCNECQPNYWGDPKVQCFPCDCNPSGSKTMQCLRNNGSCVCVDGISGERCDQCARGYTGNAPRCESCGECFDNWDFVIQALKDQTLRLLQDARRIKQTGTAGAYKEEFAIIEQKLLEIQKIIDGANVTNKDVEGIEALIEELRSSLTQIQDILNGFQSSLDDTSERTAEVNVQLADIRRRAQELEVDMLRMKESATELQEANVEGAFNLTMDAQKRSRDAEKKIRETIPIVYESERSRRQTERLLETATIQYNKSYSDNEGALLDISRQIGILESNIPQINKLVCDGRGDVDNCDSLCGGAGCSLCGGISCDQGAATKADNALDLGKKTEEQLNQKRDEIKSKLNAISEARDKSDEALREAIKAFESSMNAKNVSEDLTQDLEELLDRIDQFLEEGGNRPSDIRAIAEECFKLEISLTPDQVLDLARQINETVSSLTNIDSILIATAGDLATANELKARADIAKNKADSILDTAKQVLDALKEAKDAQDKAKEAIDNATGDIEKAEGDLKLITEETILAQKSSAKSEDKISELQERLDELKRKFTQNELDVKRAANEANLAGGMARRADEESKDLEKKFEDAARALDDKAKASGAIKERAERLRERAKSLAESANTKLKKLQEMDDEFDENENRLKDYSKIVEELNRQMMGHLAAIELKSNHYKTCQP